jgi:hypothetical protein
MIERENINPEFVDELYSTEERLEMLIEDIINGQTVDYRKVYVSLDEATSSLHQINSFATAELSALKGVTNIELTLSGEGVRVPQLEAKEYHDSDEEHRGMVIAFNESAVLKPLELFETRHGSIEAVWTTINSTPDGNGYTIEPNLVVRLKDIRTYPFTLNKSEASIADVHVVEKALVRLDGSSQISMRTLEKIRSDGELHDHLAKFGILNSLFYRQLNNVQAALHNEHPTEFVDLIDIKKLHRIGTLGESLARKSYEHSHVISQSIMNTFGSERFVSVSYATILPNRKLMTPSVKGKIIEVLMPQSFEDETEPSLILEVAGDSSNSTRITKVPFAHIVDFKF